MNNDIIYGRNPVIEAMETNHTMDKILIQDGLRHSQIGYIRNLAKERGIVYQFVDKRKLDKRMKYPANPLRKYIGLCIQEQK